MSAESPKRLSLNQVPIGGIAAIEPVMEDGQPKIGERILVVKTGAKTEKRYHAIDASVFIRSEHARRPKGSVMVDGEVERLFYEKKPLKHVRNRVGVIFKA